MSGTLDLVARLAAERAPFVLATVVWRRGPSSGREGAKAVILPDGSLHGWLGGACAEPTVVKEALQALVDGDSWEGDEALARAAIRPAKPMATA